MKAKYSSIQAFAQHLEDFLSLLEYIEGNNELKISAHLLKSSSESNHLILYDESVMEQFQDECDIYVDCTFKICPDIKGVQQILTIMGKKHNIVSIMK